MQDADDAVPDQQFFFLNMANDLAFQVLEGLDPRCGIGRMLKDDDGIKKTRCGHRPSLGFLESARDVTF